MVISWGVFIECLNVAKQSVVMRQEEIENWSDAYGQHVNHSKWKKLLLLSASTHGRQMTINVLETHTQMVLHVKSEL